MTSCVKGTNETTLCETLEEFGYQDVTSEVTKRCTPEMNHEVHQVKVWRKTMQVDGRNRMDLLRRLGGTPMTHDEQEANKTMARESARSDSVRVWTACITQGIAMVEIAPEQDETGLAQQTLLDIRIIRETRTHVWRGTLHNRPSRQSSSPFFRSGFPRENFWKRTSDLRRSVVIKAATTVLAVEKAIVARFGDDAAVNFWSTVVP